MGLNNYASMVEQIDQYGQHMHHETVYRRGGRDDRMVDAVAYETWLKAAFGPEVL